MRFRILIISLVLTSQFSCKKNTTQVTVEPLPSVLVKPIVKKEVKEIEEFIGQTKPYADISLMTKVEGYIKAVGFKDGGPVKKGDILYQIDEAPYSVKVKQAIANLKQTKASLSEAEKKYTRIEILHKKGAVSDQDKDSAESAYEAAKATVSAAEAELDFAELNLSYTKIKAPVDGKMAIGHISIGNYVSPQSGTLANLVSMKPIFVDISVSETLLMDVSQQNLKEGKSLLDISPEQKWNFTLKLSNGNIYTHPGKIDSFDNKVSSTTGTIKIRLEFPNPDYLLAPNQYVKLILTSKKSTDKLSVPQSAVMSDITGEYIYVIDEQNIVIRKSVVTSTKSESDIFLTGSDLKEGEKVIYQGTQKAIPGKKVSIQQESSISGQE